MSEIVKQKLESVVNEVADMNKRGYLFGFSRAKDFNALYHAFCNTNNLSITKGFFDEVLSKSYHSFKWSNQNFEELQDNLVSAVKSNDGYYYFISELNHVEVKEALQLKRILLTKFGDQTLSFINFGNQFTEFKGYQNKNVIIYGPFESTSFKSAREEGLKKVSEFLNILRIIFDFSEDGNSGFKTHFGINSINYGHYASFNTFDYQADTNWSRQFSINQKILKNDLLTYLWELIDEDKEATEIEIKIVDSLHWFGLAKMSIDSKQQFISYFILLEGLLFAGSTGSKKADLAERITKILFYKNNKIKFEDKIKVFDEIKRLYSFRGDLVHEAKKDLKARDLKYLNHIVREIFLNYIQLVDEEKFLSRTDLRNWTLSNAL